jgi:hypothetical protein
MNGLDPIPYLKAARTPPDSRLGCPVCSTHFAAKDGYVFLTHWHAENDDGERHFCFAPESRHSATSSLPRRVGQGIAALPIHSDINLLRYCQGVVDLDTKIPDCALDLCVT